MKADGHRTRAAELVSSLDALGAASQHVAAAVELAHGAVHHFCAYRLLHDHDLHHDKHQSIEAALRAHGHAELADNFRELEILRAGRWYGGKGNGGTIKRVRRIVEVFQQWAT